MAMRTATLSPMSPIDTSPTLSESDNLFRKLVLLLLLISAAALWIALLFKPQNDLPLLLSTFFADASLGLIAGFGSRFVLNKRHWFVRTLVAILVAILGMMLIGSLTHWVLGIGPIKLESKIANQLHQLEFERNLLSQISSMKIDLRTLFDFSKMDWADPVHLGLSLVMTTMSLSAWRRPTSPASQSQVVEVAPIPVSQNAPRSRRGRRTSSISSNSNGRARIQLPGGWFARLRPSPSSGLGTRSNNGSRPTVLKEPKRDQLVRPKRRRSRRKAHIQFALVEEHRCPYCLDAVTHNDSRGVKECEVCHTLHHADCWAITGMCQVPHLNT